MTLTPNLPKFPIHILGQATSRAWRGPKGSDWRQIWDKKCYKRSKNSVFMTPGGLFRQDSDRLGHGKIFFRAPEGVPKYTKKAKYTKSVSMGGGKEMPCT